MGIYSEYYKKYYADIKNKESSGEYKGYQYRKSSTPGNGFKSKSEMYFPIFINVAGKGFAKIFTVQCVVVLLMFFVIIGGKLYPSEAMGMVRENCLNYIEKGFLEDDSVGKEKAIGVFNQVKSMMNLDKKKEEYIEKNYKLPVDMESIKDVLVEKDNLILKLKDNTEVKSAFSGSVKTISNTAEEGTTLLINHGDGIEIKYGGLNTTELKEGDKVEAQQVIGSLEKEENSNLIVQIFYMGSRLNPEKCFQLKQI